MKQIIHKFSLLFLTVFFFTVAYSQNPSTIVLQSQLTDINGESVINADLTASLSLINSAGKQCFEIEEALSTNEQGIFQLSVQDISPLFIKRSEDPVVIQLTLISTDGGTWLEEDKFVVKYLLNVKIIDDYPEYSITRMEGQKLNYEYQSDIWMFTDVYPFAYIRSTFLLSFNDDITDPESLLLAAKSMFNTGDESDTAKPSVAAPAPPASRGIKGGYAVGGYNKIDKSSSGNKNDDNNK